MSKSEQKAKMNKAMAAKFGKKKMGNDEEKNKKV